MVNLICYNIEYCEGIEGLWYQYLKFWRVILPPKNLDKRIIAALKTLNPDIVALVEVDTGSHRAGKDEAEFFRDKLHMKSIVEKVKYPFEGWLRLFHRMPILKKQANALISKFKFSDIKYHLLHEGTKRVVIQASVHCPKKVILVLAHLALGEKTRKLQIEELIKIVNETDGPLILMGDFNTFNGDNEVKNLLSGTRLTDESRRTDSMTYPSSHPKRRLDYVLTSNDVIVYNYEILDYHFSDHKPVYVEFKIE